MTGRTPAEPAEPAGGAVAVAGLIVLGEAERVMRESGAAAVRGSGEMQRAVAWLVSARRERMGLAGMACDAGVPVEDVADAAGESCRWVEATRVRWRSERSSP